MFLERLSPALEGGVRHTWAFKAVFRRKRVRLEVSPGDHARQSGGDRWGELCATKETASAWADRLLGTAKMAWSPDPSLRGFFKGTTNCLSALVAAGRHDDVLALLELSPHRMWDHRRYGVKSLAALGRPT